MTLCQIVLIKFIDHIYIYNGPLLGSGLLINKRSSYICDEVIESYTENFEKISFLTGGTTSVLQPFEISINKIFKTYIKKIYKILYR